MNKALYRILDYPHAPVFDKSPQEVLAMRVRHPDGLAWRVSEGVLTVTVGAESTEYDLSELTLGQLASALEDDGFDLPYQNPAVGGKSALTLLHGASNQDQSNGDHLKAYTSLLWALLASYGAEIDAAQEQILEALRQMVMTQAEAEWLDVWGVLYGIPRLSGETDAEFAPRIPEEAFRIRVNRYGIEKAILDATGWNVRIEEPWEEIFTLDQSTLSGPDRMYDGERYGYHLIRPVTSDFVDWDKVLPVIERNRAAGVQVIGRLTRHGSYLDASGLVLITAKHVGMSLTRSINDDRALLDYMAIEDTSVKNHASRHIRGALHTSESVLPDEYAVTSLHFRVVRTYYADVQYAEQYWTPVIGWADTEETWEATAIVVSAHKTIYPPEVVTANFVAVTVNGEYVTRT
jgi:hypothetical protein